MFLLYFMEWLDIKRIISFPPTATNVALALLHCTISGLHSQVWIAKQIITKKDQKKVQKTKDKRSGVSPIHTSPKQPCPSLTSSLRESRGISQASLASP